MNPDSTDDLEEQAARWAARSAHGEMTVERHAELEAWLAADRSHRGAYLRAQAGLHALEQAVLQRNGQQTAVNDNPPAPAGWTARTASRWRPRLAIGAIGGAAVAACAAGLLMVGVPIVPAGLGGAPARQEMALTDGSVVTLGTGGQISVAMENGVRRITLESGEATFHVAKDRSRPFIVRSGDVFAQATGTIYTVRRIGALGGAVSVAEGTVLVWAQGAQDRAVPLHAGGSLSLDPGATPGAAASGRPAHFSFDNISIASAATRFNQVNQTKIVLGDPALGRTPIVGLFKADDPEQFARAAAAIAGARVTHRQGEIVIEK